jgi:hypothetical protein
VQELLHILQVLASDEQAGVQHFNSIVAHLPVAAVSLWLML